jgi:hypothetical protein
MHSIFFDSGLKYTSQYHIARGLICLVVDQVDFDDLLEVQSADASSVSGDAQGQKRYSLNLWNQVLGESNDKMRCLVLYDSVYEWHLPCANAS